MVLFPFSLRHWPQNACTLHPYLDQYNTWTPNEVVLEEVPTYHFQHLSPKAGMRPSSEGSAIRLAPQAELSSETECKDMIKLIFMHHGMILDGHESLFSGTTRTQKPRLFVRRLCNLRSASSSRSITVLGASCSSLWPGNTAPPPSRSVQHYPLASKLY